MGQDEFGIRLLLKTLFLTVCEMTPFGGLQGRNGQDLTYVFKKRKAHNRGSKEKRKKTVLTGLEQDSEKFRYKFKFLYIRKNLHQKPFYLS